MASRCPSGHLPPSPHLPREIHRGHLQRPDGAGEGAGNENAAEDSNLDLFPLETFENIAYIMAKHADPSLPDTPEEWLDGFNTFSIYQVLPQLIELWGLNVQTDVGL